MASLQEQVNTFRSRYGNVKQLVKAVIALQVVLILGVGVSIYFSVRALDAAVTASDTAVRAADFAGDAAEYASRASYSASRAAEFSEAGAEFAEDAYYEVQDCLRR
jgi:hypothetical protein